MPHFMIIGRDGTDDNALDRRMAVRDAHVADVKAGIASGQNIMAAAMLNDAGDMAGSMMLVEFDDRAALDAWLEKEPYVTGKVWQDVEVIPCAIPPVFLEGK